MRHATAVFTGDKSVAEGNGAIVTFANPAGPGPYTYSYDFDNDGVFEIANSANSSETVPATYLADGPFTRTVRGRITSSDNLSTDYLASINVINSAPAALINGASTSFFEGAPVSLSAGGADVPADVVAGFTFQWSVTSAATVIASGTSSTISFTPSDNGDYTVSLIATDKDGGISAPAASVIHVANGAPTGALAAAAVSEGSTGVVAFTGASDPSSVDVAVGFTYSYDFNNDGTFDIIDSANSSASIPAALTADGPTARTIRGRITDKDGGFTDYTATLNVLGVAPTAAAPTGPSSGDEGSPLIFQGTATDPSTADSAAGFTFNWTATRNGVAESAATGATFTFTPHDNGAYLISVTATDRDGLISAPTTATATIANIAPKASLAIIPHGGASNSTIQFTSINDPSSADIAAGLIYSYDFNNDGTFETANSASSFATIPNEFVTGVAPHIVRARIADKDGGFTHLTVTLTYPSATFATSGTIFEGSTASAQFTNPADPGPYTYSYDFDNDGVFEIQNSSAASATIPATLTAHGPATHVIHGRITSADDLGADYSATIEVTPLPLLDVTGDSAGTAGQPFMLNLHAPDVAHPVSAWTVNWGDGTVDHFGPNPAPVMHVYQGGGVFTVIASATDDTSTHDAAPIHVPIATQSLPAGDVARPTVAPAIAFKAPKAAATGYDFEINYTDDAALNLSTIADGNIVVTASNGTAITVHEKAIVSSSATSARVRYHFDAPRRIFNAAASGTYIFSIGASPVADAAGNAVAAATLGQFTKIIPSSAPDIVPVLKAKIPAKLPAALSSTVAITNRGNKPSTGFFNLTIAISKDNIFDDADVHLVTKRVKLLLKPKASLTVPLSLKIPASVADGAYYLLATIQPVGSAPELNEVNNDAVGPKVTIHKTTKPPAHGKKTLSASSVINPS